MPYKSEDFLEILSQTEFSNKDISFLFSEIRKMVELGSNEYKILKFYCDWLAHSRKDYFHREMKKYIQDIYENAVRHIKNPMRFEYSQKIAELIYFEELKQDFSRILEDNELNREIIIGETWLNLVRVLVKLLENQPLIDPIQEISSIYFSPSAEGAAILIIIFTQPVLDRYQNPQYYYKMANFY